MTPVPAPVQQSIDTSLTALAAIRWIMSQFQPDMYIQLLAEPIHAMLELLNIMLVPFLSDLTIDMSKVLQLGMPVLIQAPSGGFMARLGVIALGITEHSGDHDGACAPYFSFSLKLLDHRLHLLLCKPTGMAKQHPHLLHQCLHTDPCSLDLPNNLFRRNTIAASQMGVGRCKSFQTVLSLEWRVCSACSTSTSRRRSSART